VAISAAIARSKYDMSRDIQLFFNISRCWVTMVIRYFHSLLSGISDIFALHIYNSSVIRVMYAV